MSSLSSHFVALSGYDVIDQAHERVNALIAEAAGLAEGSGDANYVAKLKEFRSFVASHFAQEDIMMRALGFAGAVGHSALHADLLRRIDDKIALVSGTAGEKRRLEVARGLEHLIRDHEIRDDAGFHDYYERLGGTIVGWSDDLLVGVPWVDREHKELFDLVDAVDKAVDRCESAPVIRETLNRFMTSARQHFSHEEAQLQQAGSEKLGAHHAHHAALLRDLDDLLAAFDPDASALLAVDFLKFWVVDHIRRVDKFDLMLH